MPVEGLPDPALHCICRRCGRWHHAHEGSVIRPPSLNPLTRVHAWAADLSGLEHGKRFWCFACQKDPRKNPRRAWLTVMIVVAIIGLALGWMRSQGLFDGLRIEPVRAVGGR